METAFALLALMLAAADQPPLRLTMTTVVSFSHRVGADALEVPHILFRDQQGNWHGPAHAKDAEGNYSPEAVTMSPQADGSIVVTWTDSHSKRLYVVTCQRHEERHIKAEWVNIADVVKPLGE